MPEDQTPRKPPKPPPEPDPNLVDLSKKGGEGGQENAMKPASPEKRK